MLNSSGSVPFYFNGLLDNYRKHLHANLFVYFVLGKSRKNC